MNVCVHWCVSSQAVTYTLNAGMNHIQTGTLFLAGVNESYRTDAPEEIHTFDKFLVCVVCTYIATIHTHIRETHHLHAA